MLINADTILRIIRQTRQAWICGYTGSYKTSLAYRLSYEIVLNRKYVKYIFSNNRSVWVDDLTKQNDQINGVVILDEGGAYIESKQEVKNFKWLAEKLNVIYLIPSNEEPPINFRQVRIEPLWTIYDSGIPLIIYRWETKKGGKKDHGIFGWWQPSEIYGIYSRQDPGDETAKVLKEVTRITENFFKRYGRENLPKQVAFAWWETVEKVAEVADKALERGL